MKFVEEDNVDNYLGSFPHYYEGCFTDKDGYCQYEGKNYEYNKSEQKIKIKRQSKSR